MDFTTVRGKLAAGEYVKWDALEKDMMTMFQNAMTYNSPNTTFHKQAKTLMQVAKKLITLGKQGVTNFRGKTAGVVRAHNAQVAADDRAEKNAQKAAIRCVLMNNVPNVSLVACIEVLKDDCNRLRTTTVLRTVWSEYVIVFLSLFF